MITVTNLQKNYGNFRALHDINFSANKGEILALLGPNGAGKTTTMKILTGFMKADDGTVEIDGEILNSDNTQILQSKIGYLPENAPLYPELNVFEHLDFAASIHQIPATEKGKAIRQVAKTCGLMDKMYFDISELSKGYKQRVGLAQALIHDPEILILDEPTTGLDPNQIVEIRSFIDSLRSTKTIILSTHIMQEVEAIADRVVVINKGNVVAQGTPEELTRGKSAAHKTKIAVRGCPKKTKKQLQSIEAIEDILEELHSQKEVVVFTVFTTDDKRSDIARAIVQAELDLLEMTSERQKMEDVFQELTR